MGTYGAARHVCRVYLSQHIPKEKKWTVLANRLAIIPLRSIVCLVAGSAGGKAAEGRLCCLHPFWQLPAEVSLLDSCWSRGNGQAGCGVLAGNCGSRLCCRRLRLPSRHTGVREPSPDVHADVSHSGWQRRGGCPMLFAMDCTVLLHESRVHSRQPACSVVMNVQCKMHCVQLARAVNNPNALLSAPLINSVSCARAHLRKEGKVTSVPAKSGLIR